MTIYSRYALKADELSTRQARKMTAAQGHSGDWITAYKIAQVGTQFDGEYLRISVAILVGFDIFLAH